MKGVADRVNAKRGSEASAEKGGSRAKRPLETRRPGPKDMIREVRREGEGAAQGECGCSSLRVREWMLTMNSHAVEISIAGCVEEMVRALNLMPVSFFCLLFVFSFMCFVLINYWEQRLRAALAMVKKKSNPRCFINPSPREKTLNPSPSGRRPTAPQPRK